MHYYRDVVLPAYNSGFITKYELQKKYILLPKYTHNGAVIQPITYVADFYIEYKDGSSVVIDTKGNADSVAKIKRKLFMYEYPELTYKWIGYSKIDGGWCDYEYIQVQRRKRKKTKRLMESDRITDFKE